jgi:hypothetical protein
MNFLDQLKSSISAHNSQAFQVRRKDQTFQIWCDPQRFLPVADPHHKDLKMSLGALWETAEILLGQEGQCLKLKKINWDEDSLKGLKPAAEFEIEKTAQASMLFSFLASRWSFRGPFKERKAAPISLTQNSQYRCIENPDQIKKIAARYDDVNLKFLRKAGYIEELYSWMRWSPSDPKFFEDGLNTEAMALSSIESLGGRWIMKPKIFRALDSLGLSKMLVSEAPKIQSSSFLFVILAPQASNYEEQGRIFLRGWLELTREAFFGNPLSLLTDDADAVGELREMLSLKEDQVIVNILRAGPLPIGIQMPRPARKSMQNFVRP